jgi:peptidoglycan LD-endopeptidase CwlK
MINSRRLDDLDPLVRPICDRHIQLCTAAGIELLITSTYRDIESQNALYTLGRTLPGSRVTNAQGGQSWHNFRCAWDVVPLIHGKCVWTAYQTQSNILTPLWQSVVDLGKQAGAEAGADWTGKLVDVAHFQVTSRMKLTKARRRFDETGSIFRA